ncbi:hypothetical protein [Phyllobacterium endophyticum]|nr:hypothetical protein [Phyllobacterium endophyticum]
MRDLVKMKWWVAKTPERENEEKCNDISRKLPMGRRDTLIIQFNGS